MLILLIVGLIVIVPLTIGVLAGLAELGLKSLTPEEKGKWEALRYNEWVKKQR